MTAEHAALIYGIVTAGTTLFSRKAEAVWVAVLCSPQQDDVTFEDARAATFQLIADYDPIKITVALVLQKARGIAKTREPSTVDRWETEAKLAIEGPQDAVDPTQTGPAARGARWRRRHGIPDPRGNPKVRAEMAHWLGSLGSKMKFHCIRCTKLFTQVDVDGYVIRCMDAGRNDKPEPPRWCMACTPVDPPKSVDPNEEIPF